MSSELLSTLLISGALLVAGQAFAADAPIDASSDGAKSPSTDMAAPAAPKKYKKPKAAPAATAKGSEAYISGPATITGSAVAAPTPAPAPAPATK